MRLTGLLLEHPLAATPAMDALAALRCVNAARLPARTDAAGELLALADQDRTQWDRGLLHEGDLLPRRAGRGEDAPPPTFGGVDMARWIFALAFALVCYGNGAGCVESFVNYPSWRLVGAGEFTAYHAFIGPRVIAVLVVPAFIGTVCTALLLRWRPAAIPLWAVWLGLGLQMVVWLSTASIQFPIQQELSAHGFSAPLMARLIETNLWLRRLPYGACLAVFVWMAAQLAGPAATARAPRP